MPQANAVFQIVSGEERIYAKVTDAPKLMKGSFTIRYEGDMEGEGVLGELKIYLTDKLSTVYGLERFVGMLGDKKGTFVLQHTGILRDGVLDSKRSVLPGSGTGQLKGLQGTININTAPANTMPIIFNYEL